MAAVFATFVLLLALPAIVAALSIWRGYVLSILWGWFAVPAFDLPALTIPLAIGVALITGMLTEQGNNPKETEGAGWMLVKGFIAPAITLLIGWVVTKYL